MSGKPFCHRLNADGTSVLYSVGEDGHDDWGDANPPRHMQNLDLRSGKDVLWPSAPTGEAVEL